MSSIPTQNINQFSQAPVRGQLDLQITKSGVITGILSANQATELKAGDFVKLDGAITAGFVPQFVEAADNADALGVITRTVKAAKFSAGDAVEVAYFGGPVIWLVAGATIAPGQQLEASGDFMIPLNTGKLRGLALDPAVDSALFRMISLSGLVVPA